MAFGFASVLSELNLPTADFAWALLQFNVGLEMGQLMIVGVATAVTVQWCATGSAIGRS